MIRLWFISIAAACSISMHAEDAPPTQAPSRLYGEVKHGDYIAPQNHFRVAVPVLPELGGQIHDTENVVTFDDDLSVHVSIACFPLDVSQKWELETRDKRDYLTYFYTEFVFSEFLRRYPGAANEQSLFSPELKQGVLFVFTLLPGGSSFAERTNVRSANDAPLVAKRGTLLFVQDAKIFILSLELAERITQHSTFEKTAVQENEILRERLLALLERLQIPTPAPAPTEK